jgi:chemotaxis protein methyltransferase CheR
MTGSGPAGRAASVRLSLRAAFGLGLEGLSDEQVLAAASLPGESQDEPSRAEALAQVVDRLPIDESWMFRDESLWTWLQEVMLPDLVVGALSSGRPLTALSLGCAGGQEAHSLAILLMGLLEAAGIPAGGVAAYARVLGLDASPARVALAASGQASAWSVERCPSRWLGGRVRLVDPTAGRWQVDEDVRAMCRFEVGNLLEVVRPGSEALRGVDLILCRHVLIYFRPDDAAAVVARLAAALDPGATLVLSPAEAVFATGLPCLEPVEATGAVGAFRRTAPGMPRRARSGSAPATPTPVRGRRPTRPMAKLRLVGPTSRHAQAALEHTAAGRSAEALREARAACYHDPRHLLSMFVLGRELLEVDRFRGRAVLAELLELTDALPAEATVPHAPGLSVRQVSAAAQLLMKRGDRR